MRVWVRIRVRVRFLLFYFELTPLTRDVMLLTLLARNKYEEKLADEQLLSKVHDFLALLKLLSMVVTI